MELAGEPCPLGGDRGARGVGELGLAATARVRDAVLAASRQDARDQPGGGDTS